MALEEGPLAIFVLFVLHSSPKHTDDIYTFTILFLSGGSDARIEGTHS